MLKHIKSTLFWLIIIYIVAVGARLCLTDFEAPLREDDFVYMLKSLKIFRGDFAPVASHAVGISLISAPIFYVLSPDSIADAMLVAKIIWSGTVYRIQY